jgi:hypothetical protein
MRLVHPKGTELTFVRLTRGTDLNATFSGQTWVTGTFVGRWPTGAADSRFKTPDFILVPDPGSSLKLPYFFLRDPPFFNRYRVVNIEITNDEEALRRAVGDKAANRLLERRVDSVRATGAFLIETYSVGVECDAPWARAKLVEAKLPEQVAANHRTVPEGC